MKYVNTLPLSATQKAMLLMLTTGAKFKQYENAVAKHINSLSLSKAEKEKLFKLCIGSD